MTTAMQQQFSRLKQGLIDHVNVQNGTSASPEDEEDSLALVIDSVSMLLIYKPEVTDRCAFVFCDFGPASPASELQALRHLLHTNLLMYRGGGPAFGRDPDSGHILLLCEVPLELATPATLMTYLQQLSSHARAWQQEHHLRPPGGTATGAMPVMA